MSSSMKEESSGMFSTTDRYALKLLWIIFTIAPIIAGLDKFFNKLTYWTMYIAPFVLKIMPFEAGIFIRIIGVIEIAAGILVAFIPRVGAFIVSAWLLLIVANLILIPGYFDVALRDLGLAVCAFAFGLLSIKHTCCCTRK
ncbi:MAG: hypothetical protein WC546_04665 [Candidatus Omnitrophota bacterium]